MALILKKLYHGYFWIFRDLADHRIDDVMPLYSSPLVPLSIIIIYLYIIYVLGPRLMKNREPFNIIRIIQLYNVIQIIINIYLVIYGLKIINIMDWNCAVVDYTYSTPGNYMLHMGLVFYSLKIFDLLDTIFFVLRKSFRQITFLHVYHHAVLVGGIWVAIRYVCGGESVWIPTINCSVHAVMYTYYLLATIDDKWKNVKYKKYLTQLQLVQFMIFIIIYGRLLFKFDCSYPKWISIIFVPQNIFMLLLFGDFYIKTYVSKKIK